MQRNAVLLKAISRDRPETQDAELGTRLAFCAWAHTRISEDIVLVLYAMSRTVAFLGYILVKRCPF